VLTYTVKGVIIISTKGKKNRYRTCVCCTQKQGGRQMTASQLEDVKKMIRSAFKNKFGFAPSANSIAVLEGSYDHEHGDRCTWFELTFSVGGKGWYHSTRTGELKRIEWA
jgi:hypothetical protein